MKRFNIFMLFMMACTFAAPVFSGDFDGSKPLICATVDARDCVRGEACFQGEEVGAPEFLRVDFANKSIVGPKRTTPIMDMEKSDQQLLLQGRELGYAWVLALDPTTGRFTGTLTNTGGAFVLFGNCTPL